MKCLLSNKIDERQLDPGRLTVFLLAQFTFRCPVWKNWEHVFLFGYQLKSPCASPRRIVAMQTLGQSLEDIRCSLGS